MEYSKLDELERLAAQATPGPWKADNWSRVWHEPKQGVRRTVADCVRVTVKSPKRHRANARLIAAMHEAVPELIVENRELRARVRELELDRELYREKLYESWNQTEQCIELLHDAGVNLTKWACGVESCQGCDIPECDMGDLDMVEKYASRKAMEEAAKEDGE